MTLAPQGTTTRAQMATLMMRFQSALNEKTRPGAEGPGQRKRRYG